LIIIVQTSSLLNCSIESIETIEGCQINKFNQ
jgi:hypothetical protein